MTTQAPPEPGSITWIDFTVEGADKIKDFYASVVGWKPEAVEMGNYSDYTMNSPRSGNAHAGICHARGVNQGLPPCWLIYITVEDIERSTKSCMELGGKVIVLPKSMGNRGRYAVIQDPAGAFAALFEPARVATSTP